MPAAKKVWGSRTSLDQYFPEHKVSTDEIAIMRFLTSFFKKRGETFDSAIDFGAGPTIHRMIPLAPHVKKIDVAEFLSESRREVRKWASGKKGARNWDTYIHTALQVERSGHTNAHVARRRRLLKLKIRDVVHGDVFRKFPLGKRRQYPLVTSFYCVDAVTASRKTWLTLMKNLSTLVAPKGWLILTASLGTAYSMLGDRKMHNVLLTEKDVYNVLVRLGYKEDSIEIEVISAEMWSSVGISSVLIAAAQKP